MMFSNGTRFRRPYQQIEGANDIEFIMVIEDLKRFHNLKFLPFDLQRHIFNFENRKDEINECSYILKEINGFEYAFCMFRGHVYTDGNITVGINIRNVKIDGRRNPMFIFEIEEYQRRSYNLTEKDLKTHFLDKFLEPIFNLTDEDLKHYEELHLINTKI